MPIATIRKTISYFCQSLHKILRYLQCHYHFPDSATVYDTLHDKHYINPCAYTDLSQLFNLLSSWQGKTKNWNVDFSPYTMIPKLTCIWIYDLLISHLLILCVFNGLIKGPARYCNWKKRNWKLRWFNFTIGLQRPIIMFNSRSNYWQFFSWQEEIKRNLWKLSSSVGYWMQHFILSNQCSQHQFIINRWF